MDLHLRLACLALLALSACRSPASEESDPVEDRPPSILLVFIDDMGWGDLSCFGNAAAETPWVDRLAAEGIRFEQFYANSPICSPSRVAISTGQYPQRWRITSYLAHREQNERRGMAQWLDPEAPMLARELQQRGYATGHFGKWHMGGQRDVDDAPPITAYGFDASLTNFEGMGPKLLPLTLAPGQEEPGRIWADAERLGDGQIERGDLDRERPKGRLEVPVLPVDGRAQRPRALLRGQLAAACVPAEPSPTVRDHRADGVARRAGAATLAFVDVLKELPLTLILRPFDFATLATHTYELASEEMVPASAPGALLLVGFGLVAVAVAQRGLLSGQES